MLQAVGVTKDDVILLHSNTSQFLDNYQYIVGELLGEVNTLVVPAFNYDFSTNGKPYIHERTPSQVGLFTNYLLRSKLGFRSFHPVFSFYAIGECAYLYGSCDTKDAFGKDSVFDYLYHENAKIVMLNVPATYMTFCHYVEQSLNVWYRYKKYFTGRVSKDGETWIDTFSLYVRDLDHDVHTNLQPFLDRTEACGIIRRFEINPQMYVISVTCQDLFNALRCELVQNQNAIITHKE